MADTKTPRTAEPQADYAIQIEVPAQRPATARPAAAGSAKPPQVARVFREDEDGQKFDEHGIRIGRWEMSPCGEDCNNIFMAWCFPCVSAAQINHRMGGSYTTVLLMWGITYCLSFFASAMAYPTTSETVKYETIGGYTYQTRSYSNDEDSPAPLLWKMLSAFAGLIWVMVALYLRSTVRTRYQIPGSSCGDYCCVWWCSCCALTQMATHIKSYKPGACDFGPAADALPAYDANDDAATVAK